MTVEISSSPRALGSIVLGWVLYDTLCKSPIGNSTGGLMVVLFAITLMLAIRR